MKKSAILAAVFALMVGVFTGSLTFADETEGKGQKDSGAGRGVMGKKGMMGKGMMGGMMMKGMMAKTVTATSDGGVVVQTGNQLFKYDSGLNLVKQTEIPVDVEAMKKEMEGMMKMCPMMKGDKVDLEDSSEQESSQPTGTEAVSEADHAAHH